MFELGKKYKYGSHIYTCMYVGKKYSVLESETRSEACPHTYMANGHHGWSEYKEPIVHKRTMIWYRSKNGQVFTSTRNDDKVFCLEYFKVYLPSYKILSIQEITYTENE